MNRSNISLNRKRDFSEVLNATFTFLKQEFKPMAKVMIWYAGIPIIITAIISAYYSGNELAKILQLLRDQSIETLPGTNTTMLVLTTLLTFVVYIFISGLTGSYLTLYSRKGAGEFTPEDVWNHFYPKSGWLFLLYLISFLIVLLIGAIASVILFGIVSFSSGIVSALLIFFGIIALLLVPLFYVMVPLSLSFMPLFDENRDIFSSIKRAFRLVFKNWWASFGIIIIVTIIVYILSTLFSIPSAIAGLLKGYFTYTGDGSGDGHSTAFIIMSALGVLGQFLIYPIMYVAIGIQYFNLKEQKENPELFQKISEIAAK